MAEDDRGAIIVLLYVLAVILPIGFDIGTIAMTVLRLLLLIMIVPLGIRLFSGGLGKIYPTDWLLVLHCLWSFVSIGVNNPNRVVENAGAYSLELLGGYLIGRAYIRSPAAFYRLIRYVLIFAVLSLPFAIVESQTGRAVIIGILESIPGIKTVAQVDIAPRLGLHRSQVVFAHPIHYGLFCTSVLALSWIGMRGVTSGAARYLGVFAVLAAVFLSLSSGALLAALLQIGLIAWNAIFRNVERKWSILVGLFALAYIVIDLLSNRTPLRVFMSYATFSAHNAFYRAIIFEWGMINVWNNPIFGLGLRSWIRPSFMKSGSIDNFWLVAAVKFGFPGFLTLAGAYADAMWRIGRRRLAPGSALSDLRLAWMITFVGLTFTLATVHIWTSIFSYVFFLLGAGMWMINAPEAGLAPVQPPDAPERTGGPMWSRPAPELKLTRDRSETPARPRQDTRRYTRFDGSDG
ncbi:O-antigen ligase [Albidovulum inexpectatum]|uniref:O-antigen ligase n=1 Tax=Albidovulum inexpectatum TaxID=196587 RepID=A0A2S5JE50_9RHOB|nr:O-antigen ligase family protein [Albidovulum inexpectatum]PPB79670.1 O-antigen ligase [Albidovulum inexpectatum]